MKSRAALPDNLYWKGNKIYYVVSHNGIVSRGTTGTDDPKKAAAKRDQIKAKMVLGEKAPDQAKGVMIPELLDDYLEHLKIRDENKGRYKTKTSKKTGYTVNRHVRPFFRKIRANRLETRDLTDYVQHRIAEYRAMGKEEGSWVVSINRELSYLRASMRLGMEATPKKVFSVPSFKKVIDTATEKKRRRKGFITDEQYRLLVDNLSDHMKPVLPFVMYSGVRSRELKFIRREQVDWDIAMIHLREGETKDGEARAVPILDIAVEPLKNWMAYTAEFFPSCKFLFHYNGKQIEEWRTAWDNACRRAGLQRPKMNADGSPMLHGKGRRKGKPIMENIVKFHDTRRTTITHQGRAGVTEADSMRTTGHKTTEVHRGYDQDVDAAKRTQTQMNKYLNGKTSVLESSNGGSDKLKTLTDMYFKGLLTDEEFMVMKSRL
jgi:integrase